LKRHGGAWADGPSLRSWFTDQLLTGTAPSLVAACRGVIRAASTKGTFMRASTAVSMRPILSMIALALALFGAASTRADENDPPARAARLGFIQGSVSFNPAGTQDWVAAPLNRPLTTGDQLWADRGGRAELQLDGSSLRLGASTSMAFLNLSDQATQVQLTAGTLLVHVRHLYDQETYEIDTPNL